MANTGMRTIEARNLRWRDVDARIDKQGRQFSCLNVRGKNKYRELVAPQSVATYFDAVCRTIPRFRDCVGAGYTIELVACR
jgi:integrase